MEAPQYSCTKCGKCGEIQFSGDEEHFSAVKCGVCGKLHATNSDTFVAVAGNITRGFQGGIVGPNIKNDIVNKVSIFCVGKCFCTVCDSALYLDSPAERDEIVPCAPTTNVLPAGNCYDGSDYDGSNIS